MKQREKIDHLGIAKLFDEIHIVPSPAEKFHWLERYVANVGNSQRIDVVGDRLDMEICFGKQLGCRTVRVMLPYAHHALKIPNEGQDAGVSVTNFLDLCTVLTPS